MPPWKAAPHVGRQVQGRPDALRSRISPPSSPGPRPDAPEGNRADLPPPREVLRRLAARHARPGRRHRRRFRGPGHGRRHLSLLCRADQPARRISTSRRSSTGRAIAASSITSWRMWISRARPAKRDAGRSGPGLYVLSAARRSDPRRPGRLGARQPAQPLARRHRPVAAQECRRHHPGALPPQRQGRDRSHARSASLRPQADPARSSTGAPPSTPSLELPPGESNIEIKAAWPVPVDLVAHAVTPHMHLLGRDMRCRSRSPTAACRT